MILSFRKKVDLEKIVALPNGENEKSISQVEKDYDCARCKEPCDGTLLSKEYNKKICKNCFDDWVTCYTPLHMNYNLNTRKHPEDVEQWRVDYDEFIKQGVKRG
jgi:hypothetical protein